MDTETDTLKGRGGQYLPPIHRIRLPETKTQSALIRWLFRQGYAVKDIHKSLGIRYQQVRNIVTTVPKRAMREDLPPDGIELSEPEDILDTLLGDELERTHLEARKQAKRAHKEAVRREYADAELDHEDFHVRG